MKKINVSNGGFNKFRALFSQGIYRFRNLSTYKHLLIAYLIVTILGAAILMLPIARNPGTSVSFMDALFTAASAFSDTGLVSVDTHATWSYFGQAIIAILILNGGIGLFSLKVYIINIIFGRQISFNSNLVLSTERGSIKIGISRNLIKVSITLLLIFTLISAVILTLYFYYSDFDTSYCQDRCKNSINPQWNWAASFRFGLFHAISALNNAGFDIIGADSLAPYYFNYGIQILFMILFVVGGIGFPVIYDVYLRVKSWFTKETFRWSLFTKLSMITYVLVSLVGIGLVLIYEIATRPSQDLQTIWTDNRFGTKGDKIMAFIFNTLSTRNAGFSTISMLDLTPNSNFIYIILMFIGSAPSSTAGGIRTTTIAIIVLGIWNRIRGRREVRAFGRVVESSTVERAFIVFLASLFLVLIVCGISATAFEQYGGKINTPGFRPVDISNSLFAKSTDRYTFLSIVFEAASAFGTTGLSLGITKGLSTSSKVFMIIIMFIGQLGVSSTILLWGRRNSQAKRYTYVSQDITIG